MGQEPFYSEWNSNLISFFENIKDNYEKLPESGTNCAIFKHLRTIVCSRQKHGNIRSTQRFLDSSCDKEHGDV